MGRLLTQALGSIIIMALAAMLLSARHPVAPPPQSAAQEASVDPWSNAPATNAQTAPRGPSVLTRDRSGQFHLDGFVNGRQSNFLVDTGADLVAIPVQDAARLGLEPRPEDFRPMLQTASGTAEGARVRIDRLEVAGAALTGVDAVVVRGLDITLLGQSALKQLGKVTLRGDTMIIEPG